MNKKPPFPVWLEKFLEIENTVWDQRLPPISKTQLLEAAKYIEELETENKKLKRSLL